MNLNLLRVTGMIVVLCLALPPPTRAESLQTVEDQVVAGIVVASVAVGVLVTVLVLHYRHKRSSITGCVNSGSNGVRFIVDEKDKRMYTLSSGALGIQPGDRMTLQGKREQSGKALVFQAQTVTKDFGVCPH
jgi:hypothetical protein